MYVELCMVLNILLLGQLIYGMDIDLDLEGASEVYTSGISKNSDFNIGDLELIAQLLQKKIKNKPGHEQFDVLSSLQKVSDEKSFWLDLETISLIFKDSMPQGNPVEVLQKTRYYAAIMVMQDILERLEQDHEPRMAEKESNTCIIL